MNTIPVTLRWNLQYLIKTNPDIPWGETGLPGTVFGLKYRVGDDNGTDWEWESWNVVSDDRGEGSEQAILIPNNGIIQTLLNLPNNPNKVVQIDTHIYLNGVYYNITRPYFVDMGDNAQREGIPYIVRESGTNKLIDDAEVLIEAPVAMEFPKWLEHIQSSGSPVAPVNPEGDAVALKSYLRDKVTTVTFVANTKEDGRVMFSSLNHGSYQVAVNKAGYNENKSTLTVTERPAARTIFLTPS